QDGHAPPPAGHLERPSEPASHEIVRSQTIDPLAAEDDRTAGRPVIAADDIDERRLPGAVRPDQAADLWPVHRDGDAVEGDEPPEVHRDPLDPEIDRAALRAAISPRRRRAARRRRGPF